MARITFVSGTLYELTYPDDMKIDLEDAYRAYWDGELPEGIEVEALEQVHYWQGEEV